MLVIITPAKGINKVNDNLNIETQTPQFLEMSEKIMNELKKLEIHEIATLMKINDNIAQVTFMRCQDWEKYDGKKEKPALFEFSGEVYRGIDPYSFTKEQLEFCNSKIRILSGLYGSLKPLDGMKPYRLEMGTKLSVGSLENLYKFWTEILTKNILDDVKGSGEEVLVNLASNEYIKVLKLKNKVKVINIIFKERNGFKLRTVVVHTKRARGLMVKFIVKNRIENSEKLKNFDYEGYEFDEILSDENNFIFTRDAI